MIWNLKIGHLKKHIEYIYVYEMIYVLIKQHKMVSKNQMHHPNITY